MSAARLRDWVPPALQGPIGRAAGRSVRFTGQPHDWAQAQQQSGGYDDRAILDRVVQATREVVAGRAAFERDGVLFPAWEPPFQLLAPLLRHAVRSGGPLEVVDFGGSLGSSYRLCRPFLPAGLAVRWWVVEQPAFVAAGQAEFATDELGFLPALDHLQPSAVPRLMLVSSVLQYLPDPAAHAAGWSGHGVGTLLLDRTPFSQESEHRLCIQRVPRHIMPASYPMWILSQPRLMQALATHWRTVCEFPCPEGRQRTDAGLAFDFKGLVLESR